MATTIQNIELPKKPRARDTSSSKQIVSQNLLADSGFTGITQAESTSGTSWTTGVGWTIGSDVASCDGSQNAVSYLYQNDTDLTDPDKKFWEITYSITARSAGTVQAQIGGYGPETAAQSAVDTHTAIVGPINSLSISRLYIKASADFVGSIDNVLVKQVESFPNNNHGEIYSGRALEFDGVTDHLTAPLGDLDASVSTSWAKGSIGSDNIVTNATGREVPLKLTSCVWVRLNAVGKSQFIQESGGGEWGIKVESSNKITVNYLTDNYGVDSSNDSASATGTKVLEANTWYRVVVNYNMQEGAAEDVFQIYINGVLDPLSTSSELGSTGTRAHKRISPDHSLRIGSYGNGESSLLDGALSDYQVWFGNFTADDAAYDYANPESLALNASGSALTESNLKLWYPMQDGHRGQQSYILDGANTGLGDEMVTNGDFATDSDWSRTGTWSIENNYATGTGDGSSQYISQDIGIANNTLYKISYEVLQNSLVSAGSYLALSTTGGFGSVTMPITVGTHVLYLVSLSDGASDDPDLKIGISTNVSSGTIKIDNVSVKAINDKHHATTVFTGDELVENESFASSGDWTAQTGWTVSGNGVATVDSSAAGTTNVTSTDMAVVVGRTYYAEMYVDSASGTGLRFDLGGVSGGSYLTTTGLRTATITALTTAGFSMTASGSDTAAQVSRVSVKEVGVASGWTDADQQLDIAQTALQSYNELAWFDGTTASDAYVDLDNAITTSGNSWSLSFWVFHDDNGQDYDIILGDGANQFITLHNNTIDKLSYRDSVNAYHAISDAAIPESEWVHIVITATANASITAYVNGVAQATNSTMTNTTLLLERFMRGYSNANYQTFGTINEISYYSDVLTSAEVLDLFNDGKAKSALEASGSAGLVGYWRNNGLSEWKDLKGSNDGNTSAGVVETILIPEGVDTTRDSQGFIMNKKRSTGSLNMTKKFGAGSAEVDGYVDLGSTRTVADGDAFSLCVWLKPDDLDSNNYFIGGGAEDWIKIQSSTTIMVGATSITATFTIDAIAAKEWVHVAIVKKADDVGNIYINGDVSSSTIDFDDKAFDYRHLGARQTEAYTFRGQVDGFLLYNSELDETEVLKNYKATKGSHEN